MIENIRISNIASYDVNGINIVDLKKINFFYGANGCGKTTISNYLANMNADSQELDQCVTTWESGRPLKTLVYNKKFRDDNFGTGTVAGVFTLGQATNEDIANINNKKQEVSDLRNSQSGQKETLVVQNGKLKTYEDNFTSDCWAVYKQYESTLKDALYGHINSKPKFSQKILEEKASNSSDLLTFEALQTKATTLFGERPTRIDPIPTIEVNSAIQEIEQSAIWQKVIIGKTDVDIASLITKLGNSDWVDQGRAFIIDDDTCPFCQQPTVNGDFKGKIEEYFDEEFKRDKNRLINQQNAYTNLITPILSTLDQIEASEKKGTETNLDIENFVSHLKAIHSQVSENKLLIREKIQKTSQQVSLTQTKEELEAISAIIKQANEVITKHNQLVVDQL